MSFAVQTIARDPLVLVFALFAVTGTPTHLLFRRYPIGRAMVRVVFLILLTIALVRADIVPYQPLVLTGTPFRDAVHVILKIAWWLLAAWFLVGVLPAVVVFNAARARRGCRRTYSRASFISRRSLPSSPVSSISRSRACWPPRASSRSSSVSPYRAPWATYFPVSC
jgi:hypothetical protein